MLFLKYKARLVVLHRIAEIHFCKKAVIFSINCKKMKLYIKGIYFKSSLKWHFSVVVNELIQGYN